MAFESFCLRHFDVVISVTSGGGKNIITKPGTPPYPLLLDADEVFVERLQSTQGIEIVALRGTNFAPVGTA